MVLLWYAFYFRKWSLTQIQKYRFLLWNVRVQMWFMCTSWYFYSILQGQQSVVLWWCLHLWSVTVSCNENLRTKFTYTPTPRLKSLPRENWIFPIVRFLLSFARTRVNSSSNFSAGSGNSSSSSSSAVWIISYKKKKI